jgi:hypothetical protein
MGCANDKVTIRNGRNVWVLARTDRDGADVGEVLQTAGGVLKRFLGSASPAGTRSVFEVLQSTRDTPHGARYVIGAARPVLVDAFQADSPETAIQQQPTIPDGVRTDYFVDCPTFRTIAAARPWYVTVEFDWRAPATSVDWPRRAVNFLGMPYDPRDGLDWLLLSAGHKGKAEESDTSLLDEVSEDTGKVILAAAEKAAAIAKPVLVGLAIIAGGGAVVYLVHQYGRRSRRSEDD